MIKYVSNIEIQKRFFLCRLILGALMSWLSDEFNMLSLIEFQLIIFIKYLGSFVNDILNSFDSLKVDRVFEVNKTLLLVKIRFFYKLIDFRDNIMLQFASLP
jgi:hypothetical protein